MTTQDIVTRTLERAQHAAAKGPVMVDAETLRAELRAEGLHVIGPTGRGVVLSVMFEGLHYPVSIAKSEIGYDAYGWVDAILTVKGAIKCAKR